MSNGFINSISIQDVPNSQVNFSNGIQAVKIDNLNANANSVLYSTDGVNIIGDSAILKFDQDLKKLTVNESLSYVSLSPIAIETANNDNEFFTGILAQNKNSADGSSTHILITNDLGTDYTNYAGLDIFSSNSTIQNGQFGTMPNALGLSSQTSSIVLTSNSGGQAPVDQNENIFLCYANGTKAIIIDRYGRLVVGADNPDFSASTYGGDDGGTDKVLTSNGTAGLKWETPASIPTDVIVFKRYGADVLPVQSALSVDVVPVFSQDMVAADFFLQFYTELYCTVVGYQTYTLLVDDSPVAYFQAGMSQILILNKINYTFTGAVTAGNHTFKITCTASAGTMETNANSSYQYTLTQKV
jgi:hypothetical protein